MYIAGALGLNLLYKNALFEMLYVTTSSSGLFIEVVPYDVMEANQVTEKRIEEITIKLNGREIKLLSIQYTDRGSYYT